MRTTEWTTRFKKDYKREKKGRNGAVLDHLLFPVVELLAQDQTLEPRFHDHGLSGDWSDHRDCHIRPDLILIYQKDRDDILRLVRLGSHSELGLWRACCSNLYKHRREVSRKFRLPLTISHAILHNLPGNPSGFAGCGGIAAPIRQNSISTAI